MIVASWGNPIRFNIPRSLSTSTAESEIKAVNQCLKEAALVLRGMLNLMGFPQDATIIEENNQACVYASEIPHMTRGMRHLDLAELLIKEKVDAKEIKLLKVASAYKTSDLGTKRLALPLFNKLTSRIIDKTLRVNLEVVKFMVVTQLQFCCLVCLSNENVSV